MRHENDNWDDSIPTNEAMIDGKVVPYDACGEASDENALDRLKQTYSKAFPVYLGFGNIHTVQRVRQYGLSNLHFFAREAK